MDTSDNDIAGSYQQLALRMLERSGYMIRIDFDLMNWVNALRTAPRIGIINPSFDPTVNDLDPKTSFWIEVSDGEGLAATITNRLIVTSDYVQETESGRVHYAHPTAEQTIRLEPTAPRGKYHGRVGNAGGLWIHPRARKQGLSWILPRLIRTFSVRLWDVDRHCALVFSSIKDAGLVKDAYGFPDVHLFSTGYFPPAGKVATVYLIHIERRAIVDQFLLDIDRMSMNGDKHMREIATIVTKRNHQSAVA